MYGGESHYPKFPFIHFFLSLFQSFAVELQAESQADLDMTLFREQLEKAGGANYGTGFRDN